MPPISPEQRIAIAIGIPAVALLLFLWYRSRQNTEISDDEDDEDEEETSKVSTVFETKIEVSVPQNIVGSVIGVGGENIKRIQKESGAYIRFKDHEKVKEDDREDFDERRPSEEEKKRIVVIKGEREKAKKAEMLIKKVISDQPKVFTVEHYIPQKSCGRVIGRGGTTIRQLNRISGAKITIDKTEIRNNEPKLCTIKGTAEQIATAKGLIDEQVAEHELAMARKPIKQKQVPTQPIQVTPASQDVSSSAQFPNTADYVEVFISAVDNPGHFWVQLVRTADAQKLDALIDALTNDATQGAENNIVDNVEVGMVYSAPFSHDESRYRGQVTKINDDGTVDLFFVDYGDSETVPKSCLRNLKREQLQLPFQSIECYLANTKPKDDAWNEQATEDFKELTHYPDWKIVIVKAVRYCGSIPCLDVYDTLTEQDIWINDEMIKRGYAVEDQEYPVQPPLKRNDDEAEEHLTEIKKDSPLSVSEEMPSTKGGNLHQNQSLQDETDAGEGLDLHLTSPVSPQKFSPIKNAFVKRVSKDYIQAVPKQESNRDSKDVNFEGGNSQGHSNHVAKEPHVQAEVQSQAESAPEVGSLLEMKTAPEKYGMYEPESVFGSKSKNCESQPEVKVINQPEVTGRSQTEERVSNSLSPKKNASQVLKPEVQEMIQMEVSEAFEAELTPTQRIVTQSNVTDDKDQSERKSDADDSGIGLNIKNNNEAKHVESTLNVTVGSLAQPSIILDDIKDSEEDDEDDDLETFTTTFQQQIQAKKTFVSSVTVTSTKQAAVTLVPSNEKKMYVTEVSRQSTPKSYAQAMGSKEEISQEKKSQDGRGLGSSNHSKVVEVQQIEIQAKHPSTVAKDQNVTFKSISTIGQESSQTGFDNRFSNEGVANGKKIGKIDRRSPDSLDSDSESYVSALDEPGSDTDTTSNYLTASSGATSSSTTSLDYVTADNDTDTETLRSPGEEVGTPVNSDSDDDDDEYYDSDDEYGSDAGNKTPKRNASEEHESEERTPTSGQSVNMTAKRLSDLDLGYRGDAEDTTASREDLR